jgi:hypothetical protein
MLRELKAVSQIPGQPRRRWFMDDFFDLVVWYDDENEICGFQLCYNKDEDERALTWRRQTSYTHYRVDDGETKPHSKSTPILVADGIFDNKVIADRFKQESKNVERLVSEFVLEKILRYKICDGSK